MEQAGQVKANPGERRGVSPPVRDFTGGLTPRRSPLSPEGGPVGSPTSSPAVRDRQAGRAGPAPHAGRAGPACRLRLQRRRAAHHRCRPGHHAVDRPPPDRPDGDRSRYPARPVPGRPGPGADAWPASRSSAARPTCATCPTSSAPPPQRTPVTALSTSPSSPRSTTLPGCSRDELAGAGAGISRRRAPTSSTWAAIRASTWTEVGDAVQAPARRGAARLHRQLQPGRGGGGGRGRGRAGPERQRQQRRRRPGRLGLRGRRPARRAWPRSKAWTHHRPADGLGRALPHRPGAGADWLRLCGLAGSVSRSAPPLSRRPR